MSHFHWDIFHWIAGSFLALVWFSRLLDAALGMPKVADISHSEWNRKPATPAGNPRVSIIVPARNEEEHIGPALTKLLTLDYDNYEIIAVNDRSTDRTGEVIDRVASRPEANGRLKVIHIAELPSGWLGKVHAMWSAANQATGDWLLFTDADVLFRPDVLTRALAYAEAESADHLVLFPRIIMHSPGERITVAFFQTLFVFGHRPWKVADPKTKDHIGVGAFNLIRRRVYDAVGGYKALRFEVVDDMKLGKIVKNAGYAQRNVYGADLISLRWAKGAMGMVNNLTKNSFAIMSFQPWRLLLSAFALAFLKHRALRRNMACSRMGSLAVCARPRIHIRHLCRNVLGVRHPCILFCPASHRRGHLRLHHAAFHDADFGARWSGLAGYVLSP